MAYFVTTMPADFAPLPQQKSASERVGDRLRDLIASGNLAAGEKLPSENELARALQVSRPVVREALRGLSMMGIVESNQGGGCYVTDLSASRLMSPLSFYLQLRDHSMEELFRARSLIDCGLASDAARSGDMAAKAQLMEMARIGHDLAADPVMFRVMDAQFHRLIAELGANSFLFSVSQSLYSLAIDLRRQASHMPGVTAQSASDHQAIATAISAGDADAAGGAMLAHVEHIRLTTAQAAENAVAPLS